MIICCEIDLVYVGVMITWENLVTNVEGCVQFDKFLLCNVIEKRYVCFSTQKYDSIYI